MKIVPRHLFCVVALAGAFSALSCEAVEYKCKGKDGQWAAENCVGAAAPVESNTARAMRQEKEDKAARDARFDAYSRICYSEGYTGMQCQFRKEDGYDDMQRLERSQTLSDDDRAKLVACKARWYKETVGVVDGEMWRYCYFH